MALLFEQIWPRAWLLLGLAGLFIGLPGGPLAAAAGVAPQDRPGAVRAGPGRGVIALLRVRWPPAGSHPPRGGRLRRPASPGILVRGHAEAGRRGPAHGRSVEGPPTRLAEMLRKMRVGRSGAAHRPLRPLRPARSAASQRLCAHHRGGRQRRRPAVPSAFRFGPLSKGAEARLDAWITPPAYTGKPPIMLADGGYHLDGADAADRPAGRTRCRTRAC